ncbi:hypothetical protein MJO28_003898 [Puccinia striiformis f. sp. tritici]|uniref:Uncharacterized protein n=1 Tax=Puccinia striiformis f. sp. tritici TaxID=168172 RepID=A0ACC0EP35_9BASI|nr:hypothetical protein MJO28_003898 [Puccinia striiformis f. sp. tritici]
MQSVSLSTGINASSGIAPFWANPPRFTEGNSLPWPAIALKEKLTRIEGSWNFCLRIDFTSTHSTLSGKIYIILLSALLYIHPSQSTPPLGFDTAGKDAFQGKPLNEVHMITSEICEGSQAKYKGSDKAVFLLDHDPLHDKNDPVEQKRINLALEKLAADPRNEIWLVTARDVEILEETYRHIKNLNFALSKKNVHKVKLPELGDEFRAIKRKASKIFSENAIPFKVNEGKYFIEYKIPNWGKEWFRLGAMQNQPLRPVKNVEPYESRFYRIEPAIDRLMEFRRNVADLEAMVQDNPAFKDYVVQYWELNDGRRVALRHKYDSKETLFTALLARDEDTPVYFGLLLGDTFTDEGMHLTMRSKNLDALVVKSADEVEKLYSNTQSAPHEVWDTVASHRLVDHNDVIKLLEELVETPQSAPRVDPIRLNAPASHGVERLKTLLRQFKESINVCLFSIPEIINIYLEF